MSKRGCADWHLSNFNNPDSERTMCTFLGTAGKINEIDINESTVKQSEITFLEGYLWDKGNHKKLFKKL